MTMLRSMKDMKGYILGAQDGEIGRCHDFLFDDEHWATRYIVADTRRWLPGRKVLISPIAIGDADGKRRLLSVGLTKEQIKDSPPLDAEAPVSRQFEITFNKYYDWAHYWGGPSVWGAHLQPRLLGRPQAERQTPDLDDEDPHLRSAREVTGYDIQATDTNIGHVEDFIVDSDSWIIRFMVVDTGNWIPGSKKVLIAPSWIDAVDWKRSDVQVDLESQKIKQSPEYNPTLPVNREYETRLYDFYGRPYYW